MKRAVQFYDMGLEEYPLRDAVVANILLGTVIAAGTIACWLVAPPFGLAYLAFFAVMIYVVLRRLVCSRCYYYGKRCGVGWGLLAAMWFSKGRPEEFNESPGLRLAPVTYGLLTLIPLICLVVLLLQQATTTLVILLAVLLAFGFYTSGPGRRRACAVCKMRLFCKGSAAK